jgi:hypothetical protein
MEVANKTHSNQRDTKALKWECFYYDTILKCPYDNRSKGSYFNEAGDEPRKLVKVLRN